MPAATNGEVLEAPCAREPEDTVSTPPPQIEHTAQTLIDRGARDLRALRTLHGKQESVTRRLAQTVVRLRVLYSDADGYPDLRGRSHAYREAIARMYADAEVPPDSKSSTQSLIRYHVQQEIREWIAANPARVPPNPWAHYRLHPASARDRNRERARQKTAQLRALRDAGQLEQVPDSREDPAGAALEHLERGERALSALTEDPELVSALALLTAQRRERGERALRRIEDAAAVIRGSL